MVLRVSALVVVVILCALHAPAPDPRVVAARLANGITLPVATAGTPLVDYPDGDWVCPMDKDVRANAPGNCPRCGMKLVEGIKDLVEFPIAMTVTPQPVRPGQDTVLNFGINDPATGQPVRSFEVVHEKLYHVFVVSQDLQFFLHTHPERQGDEDFHLKLKFPKPGMYRVLSDFYPSGATPQLITNTVMVPGAGFHMETAKLREDVAPQNGGNTQVELAMTPEHPVAGQKVAMFFRATPDEGVEPYLGAMAHMLAASADLIDMIHNHPFAVTDPAGNKYKLLQFNMTFPRAGVYRVWVQMQRKGVVNTVAFNIPVAEAR
jgi:Heavy metal binding domain